MTYTSHWTAGLAMRSWQCLWCTVGKGCLWTQSPPVTVSGICGLLVFGAVDGLVDCSIILLILPEEICHRFTANHVWTELSPQLLKAAQAGCSMACWLKNIRARQKVRSRISWRHQGQLLPSLCYLALGPMKIAHGRSNNSALYLCCPYQDEIPGLHNWQIYTWLLLTSS